MKNTKGADWQMPGAVTLIRSGALADAAQYAYAATAPPEARMIFLAGACPLNQDGTTADIGDYAAQARRPWIICASRWKRLVPESGK